MKPTFLLIGLFICTLMSPQAGAQCKYVKETTDPFTKKVTKAAQMAIGDPFAMKEVLFEHSNGKLYFGLRIVFSDMEEIPFKKGDKISFMLANDDLIEITPEKNVPAQHFTFMDKPMLQWIVMQEVPKKLYERIAASPIIAVKFHLKNDYPVNGIKDRQTKKIMENATCMLTDL